jgi:hypothetical protein
LERAAPGHYAASGRPMAARCWAPLPVATAGRPRNLDAQACLNTWFMNAPKSLPHFTRRRGRAAARDGRPRVCRCAAHALARSREAASLVFFRPRRAQHDYLCNSTESALLPAVKDGLARERERTNAARARALASVWPAAPTVSIFVSTTGGSDAGSGTRALPFATLQRAAAAARAVAPRAPGDVAVFVRSGTYYLGDVPLRLTEADSNVSWVGGWPDEAPSPVVLSGARELSGLSWGPASGGPQGALSERVDVKDERGDAWRAAHPGRRGAGPPPLVMSLFINGQCMVRARFPNANPDDGRNLF